MDQYIFGIDIGGTNIKLGLFKHESLMLVHKIEISTPKINQRQSIFDVIVDSIEVILSEQNVSWDSIHGIGLAVPCPVTKGYIGKCPNLSWEQMDVVEEFRVLVPSHVSVSVANDANAAALGEHGSKQQFGSTCLFTLGTGIGGGIVVGGVILEGSTGLGGEIGHMHIDDGITETCGCGSRGCLEQVCGTKGILNETTRLAHLKPTSIDLKNLTVKAVFDAAKKNDQVGFEVVDKVAKYIAKAASIISVIVDPDAFIIGGGVSKSGEFLIELIKKHYQKFARFASGSKPFLLAEKGNDAGFIGAALLVCSIK